MKFSSGGYAGSIAKEKGLSQLPFGQCIYSNMTEQEAEILGFKKSKKLLSEMNMKEITIQEYSMLKKRLEAEIAGFLQNKVAEFQHQTGVQPTNIYIFTETIKAFGLPDAVVVTGSEIETDI